MTRTRIDSQMLTGLFFVSETQKNVCERVKIYEQIERSDSIEESRESEHVSGALGLITLYHVS